MNEASQKKRTGKNEAPIIFRKPLLASSGVENCCNTLKTEHLRLTRTHWGAAALRSNSKDSSSFPQGKSQLQVGTVLS